MIAWRIPAKGHDGFVGQRLVDDRRPVVELDFQVRDQPQESVAIDRCRAMRQQHGLARRAVRAVVRAVDRHKLHGQRFDRQHVGQPFQRPLSQLLGAAGKFQILGQVIEQADFFIGRRQVERKAAQLLLQAGGASVGGQLVDQQPGNAQQSGRRPDLLVGQPCGQRRFVHSEPWLASRLAIHLGPPVRLKKVPSATTLRSPTVRGNRQRDERLVIFDQFRALAAGRPCGTVRPSPTSRARDARRRCGANRPKRRREC